ncbi:MAG: hypothetical protein H6591_09785 [Flavobacteriales bacterium]|nr:hypothetical protein [Flavobacteriales bacterium]
MALSTIQGQTPLGTTKPGNLKASIPTELTTDKASPLGYGVTLEGKLDNSNPGMYGMVFGYTVPAGKSVNVGQSGSLKTKGSSQYDYMKVAVMDNAKQAQASTEYWEVWFKESDVLADGWSTEVVLMIGTTTYTYVLTKKRTGDGLDAGVLTDYQEAQHG